MRSSDRARALNYQSRGSEREAEGSDSSSGRAHIVRVPSLRDDQGGTSAAARCSPSAAALDAEASWAAVSTRGTGFVSFSVAAVVEGWAGAAGAAGAAGVAGAGWRDDAPRWRDAARARGWAAWRGLPPQRWWLEVSECTLAPTLTPSLTFTLTLILTLTLTLSLTLSRWPSGRRSTSPSRARPRS